MVWAPEGPCPLPLVCHLEGGKLTENCYKISDFDCQRSLAPKFKISNTEHVAPGYPGLEVNYSKECAKSQHALLN